jgi:hypothetical protein
MRESGSIGNISSERMGWQRQDLTHILGGIFKLVIEEETIPAVVLSPLWWLQWSSHMHFDS